MMINVPETDDERSSKINDSKHSMKDSEQTMRKHEKQLGDCFSTEVALYIAGLKRKISDNQ